MFKGKFEYFVRKNKAIARERYHVLNIKDKKNKLNKML